MPCRVSNRSQAGQARQASSLHNAQFIIKGFSMHQFAQVFKSLRHKKLLDLCFFMQRGINAMPGFKQKLGWAELGKPPPCTMLNLSSRGSVCVNLFKSSKVYNIKTIRNELVPLLFYAFANTYKFHIVSSSCRVEHLQ